MNDPGAFRRLVLGLHPGAAARAPLQSGTRLAKLLHVELHAVFIEDPDSLGAASLPFTRELRLPTHDWHDSNADRLRRELDSAAARAEAELAELGLGAGIAAQFEVRRGDPVLALLEMSSRHDVVAIQEGDPVFEGLTRTAARLRRAALASDAHVLLLPRHFQRPEGPIVAIAAHPSDPVLAVAQRMAMDAGRELQVLDRLADAALAAGSATFGSGLVVGGREGLPEADLEWAIQLLRSPILIIGERPEHEADRGRNQPKP